MTFPLLEQENSRFGGSGISKPISQIFADGVMQHADTTVKTELRTAR